MASSSPYQNNDYAALSTYRPYKLPINDIFKANVALNSYWDEGAARVKGVNDTALNLQLSLAPNKDIRDQFLKDADKQITKLSAMNLADASVQRQGFEIYKPLFKDEGIISDDAATKTIGQINSDAMKSRSENNGKFYSHDNHQYALTGSDEFKNSTDRMAGKKYLKQAKSYEAYYDYTDDYAKAMKGCKADIGGDTSPFYGGAKHDQQTGYMKSSRVKELSSAKATTCLEAGMTPKGYRQLQIEGSVRYRGNKEALGDDTITYFGGINANTAVELQRTAAMQTVIREDKTMDAKQKEAALKALDDKSKGLQSTIDDNSSIINKLNNKDYSIFDDDFDRYAGSVYTYRKLHKEALANAFREEENKYIADPKQMADIKFIRDGYFKQMDFNNDVSMKQLDLQNAKDLKMFEYKYGPKKEGETQPLIYTDPATGLTTISSDVKWLTPDIGEGAEPNEKAYSDMSSSLGKLTDADNNNNLGLYNQIIKRAEADTDEGKAFKKELMGGFNVTDWDKFKASTQNNRFGMNGGTTEIGGIQNTAWFKAYFPLKKDDATFNEWANKNSSVNIGIKTIERRLELGDQEVLIGLRTPGSKATTVQELTREQLAGIPDIKVGGKVITARDVQNVLEGGVSKNGVFTTDQMILKSDQDQVFGGKGTLTRRFLINGKGANIKGNERGIGNSSLGYLNPEELALRDMILAVKDRTAPLTEKINNKRKEVYSQMGFARDRFAITPDSKGSEIIEIQGMFPVGEKDEPNKNISIVGSDFAGSIKINHPGVGEDDLVKYRRLGVGTTAEIKDGFVILRNTDYNVVPKAIDSPVMRDVAYQLSTIGATRDFLNSQNGQHVKSADVDMPIYIGGKKETLKLEVHNDNGQPSYHYTIKGSKLPTKTSVNAYDLMEQLNILSKTMNFKMTTK